MENEVLLRVDGLTKAFLGVKALEKVELTVHKGEIRGIIGENGAGKSTLMNCIFGILKPDEGTIEFDGKKVSFNSPADALNAGIAMIHQETNLVQQFSASENVFLNREDMFIKHGYLDNNARNKATYELFESLGINIRPDAIVSNLSVAHCQLVEVARAVSCNAKLLIMDEPTSSLSEAEVELLFKIIRNLSDAGCSILFISHKIDEIFTICDSVSVYRDGKYINTFNTKEITYDDLILNIVGRHITNLYPKEPAEIGEIILEVKNLTRYGAFKDVSFNVRKGEILGICGLDGAGRSEVVESVFGISPPDEGEVWFEGKKVKIKKPKDAVALGMGMVTEDRLRMGIIAQLSVLDNIAVVNIDEFINRLGFVNEKAEREAAKKYVDLMAIKMTDYNQRIDSLSGGNQQKVIIGRWLLKNCKLLIFDEPTRGIDVGSKSEIHRILSHLAQQGIAIIMISSEMPEVLGMSDRIIVMREGNVVYECAAKDATQELLGSYALG